MYSNPLTGLNQNNQFNSYRIPIHDLKLTQPKGKNEDLTTWIKRELSYLVEDYPQ